MLAVFNIMNINLAGIRDCKMQHKSVTLINVVFIFLFVYFKKGSSYVVLAVLEFTEIDLTDIYRAFYPNTKDYTFFSAPHGNFSKIDHVLCHTSRLHRYKKLK